MKVLIFGASGSGTTTLGQEISKKTDFIHFDADDYYWKKTVNPYTEKIPLAERNEKIKADFYTNENVIISGSMVSWGEEWKIAFDLAVFIYLEPNIRMNRLKKREFERYGKKLQTDTIRQQGYKAFLNWAEQYDDPNFNGRSLRIHNEWISQLHCRILRIDGQMELFDKVKLVTKEIGAKKVNN